jgi:hypothetical protein
MRAALALVLGLAGCDRILGITPVDDDALEDAASADAEACYGIGLLRQCVELPAAGDLLLSGAIDTDTDARCDVQSQAGGPQLCVISATNIMVSDFTATGARPLVLVATDQLDVAGNLSVASTLAGGSGAGAKGPCNPPVPPGGSTMGAGGGAGGSFAYLGGPGARGASQVAPGGKAGDSISLTSVRGGCRGGDGGAPTGTTPASGGAGGGAVYLIAGARIKIAAAAAVNASGAAGQGGAVLGGGGGGGSGGLIALDAPLIAVEGSLFARGGGGGGGGALTTGGGDGKEAMSPGGAVSGGGGTGSGSTGGGDGCGSPNGTVGGNPGGDATYGGGGGGGACGFIRIYGMRMGAGLLNPAATQ